ncbi:MAG: gliding motility-associated C-terminal domain-containing protein [Cyclobacteriaceae bacterium]
MRSKLLMAMLLLRVSLSMSIPEASAQTPADSCYAAYVVSFKPGVTKGGELVTNEVDYQAVVGDAKGDESAISLGIGGEIILGFMNPVPVTLNNELDLLIDERDDSGAPEKVDVYVFDGTDYVLVGENVPPNGKVNVEISGLDEIKYVKLVDVSDPDELGGNNADGYDLDRLVALHGCGTECNAADKPTATLNNPGFQCPDGLAALDVSLTGTGPWKVGYTNGADLAEALVTDSEASIPFDMTGDVRLAWVTDQDTECTSVMDGGETAFIANPAWAYFQNNLPKTLCNNGNGVWLQVVLWGKAQWSFKYSITHEGNVEEVTVKTNKSANVGEEKIVHQFKVYKSGVYKLLSVEDACSVGTIDTDFNTVTIIDTPTAQFMDPDTVCAISDATKLGVALTGGAPWELTWTVNEEVHTQAAIEDPSFYIPVSQAGTYTIKNVKSAATCDGSVLDDSVVTVLAPPVAQLLEKDTVLCDPAANIDLTVQLSGTAPYKFAYARNGITVDTVETSEEMYTLPVTGLGNYTLVWVGNACAEGAVSGEAHIAPASQEMASFSYKILDQTCNTATLDLEADTKYDQVQYRWYVDGEPAGENSKIQYQASTWKAITVSLATTNGYCVDSASQVVEIEALTANKLGRFTWQEAGTATCEGQAFTFTSDSIHAEFTYEWKVNGEVVSEEAIFTSSLAPGEYTVHLSLSDGHCLYSSQHELLVSEATQNGIAGFAYMMLDALQCDTRVVEFEAESSDSTYAYLWTINGEEVSQQSAFEYELPVGGSEVKLEVSQGKCISTTTKNISIEDQSLSHDGAFDIAYESFNCNEWALSATALDLGEDVRYQWWINDTVVEAQEQLYQVVSPGDYTVRLRTEAGGCFYEVEETVSILAAESLVNIPNVLSPQASHPDDRVIKVYGNCLAEAGFHFQVMDRWGGLVYETKSLTTAATQGWDGGNNTAGIYTYSLRARFDNGTEFQKQGTITLLK